MAARSAALRGSSSTARMSGPSPVTRGPGSCLQLAHRRRPVAVLAVLAVLAMAVLARLEPAAQRLERVVAPGDHVLDVAVEALLRILCHAPGCGEPDRDPGRRRVLAQPGRQLEAIDVGQHR